MHACVLTLVLASVLSIAVPQMAPAQSAIRLVAPPLLIAKGAEVPIQVRSLALTTEVNGGLARTRIELTFHNPNARVLEGELQFPLQPGQQVNGFALDIDGHMRAAVPVEKAKGQEVFEAVERRGVDPGLLEQTAGNQFRLRVYPIPANGERHVRIDIDQSLQRDSHGWRLQLPLSFASGVGRFSLHVIARGQGGAPRVIGGFGDIAFTHERGEDDYLAQVAGDFPELRNGLTLGFDAASRPQAFVQNFDGQRYFHVEVPLSGASVQRAMPRTIGLLWDSSASAHKRDIDGELAVLDRYFAAIGNGDVRLTRLRDVAEPTRSFAIRNGDWSSLRKELHATVYDGASALADWKPQPDVQEYLLVSDGFANYGLASEMPKFVARQRLYTLDSAGADSDATRLAAWADARGGRLVSWHGSAGVADAVRQLLQEGPHLVWVEGLGADGLVAASRFPQAGYLRIAGRLNESTATITLHVDDHGHEHDITVPVAGNAPASSQVAALWASYSIALLAAEPDLHRTEIRHLGSEFGLVSAETSLIVLDNINDYARYDIAPPAELRQQVAQLVAARDASAATGRRDQLAKILGEFNEKVAWWEKSWPKNSPVTAVKKEKNLDRVVVTGGPARHSDAARAPRILGAPVITDAASMASPMPPPPMQATAAAPRETTLHSARAVGGFAASTRENYTEAKSIATAADEKEADKATAANIGIAMQSWKPDSPFARRLREAKSGQVYEIYLDERADHADSAAFYLDVADILFERGQRELALRVLSNLAEMNLENRQLLRVLGYRLMQAHADALAVPVFEHASRLADDEPQSWRDLGLIYEAVGREQDAIDSLYKVVTGTWDSRFPSVELIALGELDAIIAHSQRKLDTRAMDPRLLRNLPLDLRVVLSWDSDNTDIDLWVTDPNGEKTYYAAPHSYQGGWLSHDCTQGYGPEEFILRNAKPGKYKVEANFFGDHEQLITGPTTLQLHLFTGFGTPRQKDEAVTMRLKDAKDTVLVGEFEVK